MPKPVRPLVIVIFTVLALGIGASAIAQDALPADVAGNWTLTATAPPFDKGTVGLCRWQGPVTLTQTPNGFTGSASMTLVDDPGGCMPPAATADLSGVVVGDAFDGAMAFGPLGTMTFTGMVGPDGDSIAGDFDVEQGMFTGLRGTWSAGRSVSVLEIPTLGAAGMAALILLLAIAAVVAVRRRRDRARARY